MRKLRIRVKRYYKPSIKKWVKGFSYTKRDIGKPGRGKKIIPIKKGKLAPYSTSLKASRRRRILVKKVRRYGATSVYRSLMAQVVFRKRLKDHAKRTFKEDAAWLKSKYGIGMGRRRKKRRKRRR